ncbi:MAG: uridine diphosphate-N-acetylglucosamine-binding protein YvcK [Clostridia bacterium]|nr:uridine diphosphate-N-acetylglucosamine-binding protein YvcK [Clostridia bacterium]
MKGLLQWFKSSSKMKRWMFLILLGIILVCYGISKILVLKEVSFGEVGRIIAVFVIGFIGIVLGLVFLNKRTLEILVESTDERMENKKNVNIKSLIFNKTVYDKGPNIVAIGGGTGLNTVLKGLKNYTSNITAIVTVSDYGEEATSSRKELEVLPLNDIKDSIVALESKDGEVDKLFNYQFKTGKLKGINFSDIYFSAMKDINKDFTDSIMKSNEVINMVGKVLPVTLDEMKICAELSNGYVVTEKSKIPQIVSEKVTNINRIYLNPSNCRPAPGVVEAIKNADCIIIGPGSLYTNVIPNLLVNGVAKAIKESAAIKVYISNIMTEPGQTDNYSVSDHLNAIIEHCGQGIVDYCIYDTGEIVPEFIKKYNLEGQDLVEQDIEKVKGIKFLQRNLSSISNDLIRHDASLVANSIIELICDDLKYQDKQNDPQYMMLSTKLKEDKRINKLKKQTEKKEKRPVDKATNKDKKRKSKFSNKYSERIASIRESDKNMAKRKQAVQNKKSVDEKMANTEETKIPKSSKPKSARGRKKTPQQIREEMLEKWEKTKID